MTEQRTRVQRAPSSRARRDAATLGLGLAALGLAALLAWAPKPWLSGVAERLHAGEDIHTLDYVITWGWWAALANLTLVCGLLATLPRWLGTPADAPDRQRPRKRAGSAAIIWVLAAVVAGGALASPRLEQSLWDDEVYSLQRSISGHWKFDGEELRFKRAGLRDALWYYRIPNNHVPHTLASRASLTLWQRVGDPSHEHAFDERALRLPAFAAGMATIAAVGGLLFLLGLPSAGAFAAWLLALHPWLLRYATEARGYSLVLLLATLLPVLLVRVLERGTWPRWGAFAAVETLLMWTYPPVAPFLVVANAVGFAALLGLHRGQRTLRPQLLRGLVANLVAAGTWLQLMAPNLAQLAQYNSEDKAQGALSLHWLVNVPSLLLSGMPWRRQGALDGPYPQLAELAAARPELFISAIAIGALAVALGTVRLLRDRGPSRWLAPLLLLPGPLTGALAWWQGLYLWEWYLIFMLPGWAALAATGVTWPLAAAKHPLARTAGLATAVSVLVGFTLLTGPPRQALRDHSLQPRREAVLLTGRSLDPHAALEQDVLTASFHVPADHYDPMTREITTTSDLLALMREADRERRPLFVNIGWRGLASRTRAELLGLVERPELFEPVAVLHGFEPRLSRHVYRYVGAERP